MPKASTTKKRSRREVSVNSDALQSTTSSSTASSDLPNPRCCSNCQSQSARLYKRGLCAACSPRSTARRKLKLRCTHLSDLESMERLIVPLISKIQEENDKLSTLLLAGASGELSGSLITEEELENLAAVVEKALQYLTGENSELRVALSERRVADSALLNIASLPWAIPSVASQPSIGSSSHLRIAPQPVPAAADPGAFDASSLGSYIAAAQSLSSVNNGGDLPVYDWEESLGEGIMW